MLFIYDCIEFAAEFQESSVTNVHLPIRDQKAKRADFVFVTACKCIYTSVYWERFMRFLVLIAGLACLVGCDGVESKPVPEKIVYYVPIDPPVATSVSLPEFVGERDIGGFELPEPVIEADTTTADMYASIDETMSKIARRMRKHKTRMLKSHRPKKKQREIRHIAEAIFPAEIPEEPEAEHEPVIIHQEKYKVKHLFSDEAIMDLEMNEKPFFLFHDA